MSNVVALRTKEVEPQRQTPLRKPNAELRTREHLTEHEVERLIEAAKSNRWGQRDATMILVAYRHGLRASELVDLQWTQVHFTSGNLDVRRRKNGTPATHPLTGRELRALRLLQRKQTPPSPYLFTSERKAPLTPEGFARMLTRVGKAAGLASLRVHPHALRHGCGIGILLGWKIGFEDRFQHQHCCCHADPIAQGRDAQRSEFSSWPTTASTPGRSRATSATKALCTRLGTPS